MSYAVYLSDDDLSLFKQFLPLIGKIIYNANQIKYEEEHERGFNKLLYLSVDHAANSVEPKQNDLCGIIKFTEKEILQMPKKIRIVIRELGYAVYARHRTTGRYKNSFEIRFNRKGYKISASGSTKEEAKLCFIEKVKLADAQKNCPANHLPTTFDGFALYWFENFHKRKVCAEHYNKGLSKYNNYLKPLFGNAKMKDITPTAIQKLLDELVSKHRVQEDIFSLLNQIFDCAVKHGVILLNPMGMCFHQSGERKHGTRIEKNEEKRLLKAYAETPIQIIFAVMSYTGLRPNEYLTAVIEGNFIKAINSKRRNGKIEYKYIPINPMLRPYVNGLRELPQINLKTLDRRFKAVLPNHTLKDMRTTFQTRCSECGIPDNVIGVWMGNSIGKLKEAYTDFSEEYLLKEAEKFTY